MVINTTTTYYLCQKMRLKNVPNTILEKVTNFGFPTVFRYRVTTTKMRVVMGESG